jgi:hypothetical protein
MNMTTGISANFTRTVASGTHYWNVTCIDQLGNRNTSLTYNFTIPMPDLTLNSTHIVFSKNNPQEYENITINATVFNVGSVPVENATANIYLGDYENGTIIVSVNLTIGAGGFALVQANWTALVGNNMITVALDPPISSGGLIPESNETNNVAWTYITVGSWNFVGGRASGVLQLADIENLSAYTWAVENLSNSNLYVTKEGALVSWTRLKALSRNATNGYSAGDFTVLDAKLGMAQSPDSVNRTYTVAGQPRDARNFSVYGKNITNVPVANSSNSSTFLTGILWDTSDGNTTYNGTQDVVLITQFNPGQVGFNGTFDYEIRIPATLRSYNGAGSTVTFYVELK